MSSGALSPKDATEEVFKTGLHHLHEPTHLTFIKNVYGGLLFGYCGLFSLIVSKGSPGLESSAPGIVRLLQGMTFPAGLILVYFVGAELFTGYPMWCTMIALSRQGKPNQYVRSLIFSWLGNLVGTLVVAGLFTYFTESMSSEPYRSGLVSQITEDIVEAQWHVIFLKAIACGHLVALAMFVGTQNQDGISKALGLYIPFVVSTTARYPHTVEYMYLGLAGMMHGAPLDVGGFLWKCMLPITLGNSVGGGLFVGAYKWWVYLYCENGQEKVDDMLRLDGEME
ncbi:hypothetical protein MMC25_005582 [Agyrium rufum]|nr:hypothetical protein [Agyrium rufum]